MVTPTFDVSIDTARTGTINGLCVLFLSCPSLSNSANVVDSDTANFARIQIPVAIGTGARIAVVDTDTYPAGYFVGFEVKDETGLLGIGLLDAVTVRT